MDTDSAPVSYADLQNILSKAPTIEASSDVAVSNDKKKKRGVQLDLPDEVPELETARPVPKRRGRPPGSKNKSKASSGASSTSSGEEASVQSLEDKWKAETEAKMKAFEAKRLKEEIKKAQKTPLPEFEPPIDEEKERLYRQIKGYYNNFPWLLETYDRKTKITSASTTNALREEIKRCQTEMSLKRALNTIRILDTVVVSLVGQLSIWAGITDIPFEMFLAHAKATRDEVDEELRELAVLYHEYLELGPEARYVLKRVNHIAGILGISPLNTANTPPTTTHAENPRPPAASQEELQQRLQALFP